MDVAAIVSDRIISTGELKFHYKIDSDSKTMYIESKDVSEQLSTLFGSPPNSDLKLDSDLVERFPHEALLSTFSVGPSPEVDGQTPDALICGQYVELATRRSWGQTSLDMAIAEKRSKYSKLSVSVIAVNYADVSSTIVIAPQAIELLRKNFCYLDSIRSRFFNACGLDVNIKYTRFSDLIASRPSINIAEVKETVWTWDKFEASVAPGRVSYKIAHLPLVILDEDVNLTASAEEDLDGQIKTLIAMLPKQHLSDRVIGKRKKSDKHHDQITLSLTSDQRVYLACRGINAKSVKHPSIEATISRRKQPVSMSINHMEIDYSMLTSNTDILLEALKNLDQINREIILNAKRYTKKNTFVVRKLLGKPCYIIMKTTGYSSDDDKPIFYCLLFKGETILEKHFEQSRQIDDWRITEFVSTNKRKLEHLVSIDLQCRALFHMLKEQNCDSQKTRNSMIFTLLADNNSLSVSQQTLRYYYMELYSGKINTDSSLKFLEKFPTVMRNPMTVWLYKSVKYLHPKILKWSKPKETNEKDDFLYEPSKAELPPLMTPWGFQIDNIDKLVLASYYGNLKNKNEQNKGHDSKVILSKILKNEYEFRDMGCPEPLSRTPEKFQCNPDWIKWGAHLIRQSVQARYDKSWTKSFNENIAMMEKQTWSELFSTKSSSTATGETYEEEGYDRRSKVFIEMIKSRDDYSEPTYHSEAEKLISLCQPSVSLFKKNQIGGVREIYILAWSFRRVIRLLEDISRAMCQMHPSETLTKPSIKDSFVQIHRVKVSKIDKIYKITFSWSGDMTHWANQFVNGEFKELNKHLLPEELISLTEKIFDLHTKKKLYLPKELIKNFLTKNSDYPDKDLKRLRDEFLGFTDPVISGKNKPYITNLTNMMQGILHYTSSIYHIAHLECLRDVLCQIFDNLIMSFVASSDDEGCLMTLYSDSKEKLMRDAQRFLKGFKSVKTFVDTQFGVRTSWCKSTLSISPIFEFNSTFYLNNMSAVPFIKFVARSIDDNAAESLHSRVSGMYSLLHQVRESGASGNLCHEISKLQKVALERNYGRGITSTFDEKTYDSLPELTMIGKYRVLEPEIAGLVGSEYVNWLACSKDELCRKMMKRFGIWTVIDDKDPETNTSYQLFDRKKYHKAIESLNLRERKMTIDDAKLLLSKNKSTSDVKRLLELRACSAGIASSFSWHARTDNVQLSVFLMSSPIFEGKTVFDIANESKSLSDCPIEQLFPSHTEFIRLRAIVESKHSWAPLGYIPSRSRKMYHPLIAAKEHRLRWKAILSSMWFDDDFPGGSDHLKRCIDSLLFELPWVKSSPKETLEASPFEEFGTLMGFFDSYGKSARPTPLLTYGPGQGFNSISEVINLNTMIGMQMVLRQDDNPLAHSITWITLENRILNWSILLGESRSAPPEVFDDIATFLPESKDELDEACRISNRSRRATAIALRAICLKHTACEYVQASDPGTVFYLKPQKKQGDRWVGEGILLMRTATEVVKLWVYDSKIRKFMGQQRADASRPYLSQEGFSFQADTQYFEGTPMSKSTVYLDYSDGFRLSDGLGGFSKRIYGFNGNIIMNTDIPDVGPATLLVNDFINGVCTTLNLSLLKAGDPFSESIARLIRNTRKGIFRFRLFERAELETTEISLPTIDEPQRLVTMDDIDNILDEFALSDGEEFDWAESFFEDTWDDCSGRPIRNWAYEERVDSPAILKWSISAETLVQLEDFKNRHMLALEGEIKAARVLNAPRRSKWSLRK